MNNMEMQLLIAIGIILAIGVCLAILIVTIFYANSLLNNYNETADEERKSHLLAAEHDAKIMEQAKKHTIQFTEQDMRDIVDNEFNFNDVKLNVNMKNAVVRTEVVYAD